jgi:hypothetical protein
MQACRPRYSNFLSFFSLVCQDSFGSGIDPKISCELNCMSKGFSCNFLDLAVRQSPQGLSCDIFEKRSQPEYTGIEMIRMPHVHSNISMTPKLGVISSQFYRFLRLCCCKKLFCLSDGCSYWLSEGKRLPFFNSSKEN